MTILIIYIALCIIGIVPVIFLLLKEENNINKES